MRKFSQWFFIIGSFVFLYWYMPIALSDNKVALGEMATIGINVLGFIVNFANFVSAKLEKVIERMKRLLTQRAPDLWDSAPLESESTPEADTPAGHLSTPPTSR